MDKSRKGLLKAYVDLKREINNPNKLITARLFKKETSIHHNCIYREFDSFSNFKIIAEEAYLKSLTNNQRALLSEDAKKYNGDASREDCINDLRLIQEAHWGKHITRIFYREHGTYSDATWSQYFGTFQEYRRQAGLELSRQQHTLERQIARHASVDHYREYYNTNVLPYYNKYIKKASPRKIKTIMIMSDCHDKEICEFSLSVFIEECRIKQPDVICFNGDIYDLLEFGRYPVDPRHYDIVGRLEFVRERIFRPIRSACPDSQIDLIAGNHEMRLLKLLCDATPNVRILLSDVLEIDFPQIFGLDEFSINWASKFNLAAYSNADIKNEAKKNYRIYYNAFAVTHIPDQRLKSISGTNGHHHKAILESFNTVDKYTKMITSHTWTQTPAMHKPDAEYLSNAPGWNTGFLEVLINIETLEVVQKIHLTHDTWTVIDGRYYGRS